MNRWKGKVAVVTGASGGIGAEIACNLVENGVNVIGLARRKNLIDDLAKKLQNKPGKLCSMSVDMSKENDIVEAFKCIEKNYGCVNILINNAALIGNGNCLKDEDSSTLKSLLDTNVFGVCIAQREAIKMMKKCNVDGHIININSVAGHRISASFIGLSIYPATKHAITAITEQVRNELSHENCKIKVTSISPGAVDTPMVHNLIEKHPSVVDLEKIPILKAEDVAGAVCYALSTPPHVNISELTIQAILERL